MKAVEISSVEIEGILVSVGTKVKINAPDKESVMAEVTRITEKSVFIKREDEELEKLIVMSLFSAYMIKGLFDVQIPEDAIVIEKKEDSIVVEGGKVVKEKKEKAPKVEKVIVEKAPKELTLSNGMIIHYWAGQGRTVKEVVAAFPEITKSNVLSTHYEYTKYPERAVKNCQKYLEYYAAHPELTPVDCPVLPAEVTEPKPEKTPKAPKEPKVKALVDNFVPTETETVNGEAITDVEFEEAPTETLEDVAGVELEPINEEEQF